MSQLLTPDEIERLGEKADLSIKDICKNARCALSTFYRWRAGKTKPSIAVYERLVAAASGNHSNAA